MEQDQKNSGGLQFQLALAAAPAVQFFKNGASALSSGNDGFQVQFSTAIGYDALTRLVNGYLADKRFELSEGLISSHVVVQQTRISADGAGNLLIEVLFGGSFSGTAFFKGTPILDTTINAIRVGELNYELETGNFLLRMAKSLLQNKIRTELLKRTVFPLQPYLEKVQTSVGQMLNKEWTTGVSGAGGVSSVALQRLSALPQHLLVEGVCTGSLVVKIVVP